MLEELLAAGVTEAGYDLYKISIMEGDQFGSRFCRKSIPTLRFSALLDQSADKPIPVFESANILLYLAESSES